MLIKAGAQVNALEPIVSGKANCRSKTGQGFTALQLAVYKKNEEMVKLLLANGADADIKIADGADSLTHSAVMNKESQNDTMALALLNQDISRLSEPLSTTYTTKNTLELKKDNLKLTKTNLALTEAAMMFGALNGEKSKASKKSSADEIIDLKEEIVIHNKEIKADAKEYKTEYERLMHVIRLYTQQSEEHQQRFNNFLKSNSKKL